MNLDSLDGPEVAYTLTDFRQLRGEPDPPAAPAPTTDPVGTLLGDEDLSWHDRAACRPDGRPADMTPAEWTGMFFPNRGQATAPARAYCLRCPVRTDCLDAALANAEKHGIWGATSEGQRRRTRRGRAA